MLAVVDLDASEPEIGAAALLQGRLVDASDDEVSAAVTAVVAALGHPVLRAAAAADLLRRETPVLARLPDDRVVEGIVDLAYHDADAGWTVVDFKTDLELGVRRDAYAHQVRIYAEAIERATGEPARGLLLVV